MDFLITVGAFPQIKHNFGGDRAIARPNEFTIGYNNRGW